MMALTKCEQKPTELPVLGAAETAEFWIRKHGVRHVIISSHRVSSAKIVKLQEICDSLQVELLKAAMKFEKSTV